MNESPHIGTLNEGGLHRGLKDWLTQPGDRLEVGFEGFVIDVVRGDLLIEIQTGSIAAMGRKLDALLDEHRIRVVRPFAAVRWLERAGRPRRKSPLRQQIWSLFDELVSIPTLLDHPHLEVQVLLVEETEVRGPSPRRGRKGPVLERRLERVIEQRLFRSLNELTEVLPRTLEEPFTTASLAAATGLKRDRAQRVCYVLRHAGLIEEVGRSRQGVSYRRRP